MSTRDQQVGGDHYRKLKVQPWDALDDWLGPEGFAGFLRGSCFKYLVRYRDKGGVEDLRKARHYLDRLIEHEKGGAMREREMEESGRRDLPVCRGTD